MTAFAEREAAEANAQKRQRQEVDADGFTTVTRGGRTAPAKQEVAKEIAEKQKGRQKDLQDFYRFQSRERRKEQAGELVRKFEQDKEKVMRMKERRGRFKVREGKIADQQSAWLIQLFNSPKHELDSPSGVAHL